MAVPTPLHASMVAENRKERQHVQADSGCVGIAAAADGKMHSS